METRQFTTARAAGGRLGAFLDLVNRVRRKELLQARDRGEGPLEQPEAVPAERVELPAGNAKATAAADPLELPGGQPVQITGPLHADVRVGLAVPVLVQVPEAWREGGIVVDAGADAV